MGLVEFEEKNPDSYRRSFSKNTVPKSVMFRLVESFGIPAKLVNFIMVVIAIIFFALTIMIFMKSSSEDQSYVIKNKSMRMVNHIPVAN